MMDWMDRTRLVIQLQIATQRPLRPFGSTWRPQCGQATGADKTVAPNSKSGAMKVLPQCGHVTLTTPLSIDNLFDVLGVFDTVLENSTTKGGGDGSYQELDCDFYKFRIHLQNSVSLLNKSSIQAFAFSPRA